MRLRNFIRSNFAVGSSIITNFYVSPITPLTLPLSFTKPNIISYPITKPLLSPIAYNNKAKAATPSSEAIEATVLAPAPVN